LTQVLALMDWKLKVTDQPPGSDIDLAMEQFDNSSG
jgi:hypothetical protein